MKSNKTIRPLRAAVHGLGKYRVHNTLFDLAETLHTRWPEDNKGEAYRHACHVCIESYEGKRTPEEAREAFIAAADDAGISIMTEDR